MKYNHVSVTFFFLYSVFGLQRVYGIRKLPDLKAKENRTDWDMKKLGEDYYDNERKKIAERYVHYNSKYKSNRIKHDRNINYTYYDEVQAGNKYKYQPLIGNKIVAVKDVQVRRKTSKLFETNDPLKSIVTLDINPDDNIISNTLENELKISPVIEIPQTKHEKRKDTFVRKPHRYFSKLYKTPSDDIDDPLQNMAYVLKDLSPEMDQNLESEGGLIKPLDNDFLKQTDFNLLSRPQFYLSKKNINNNRYLSSNSFGNNNNGIIKLRPKLRSPAKDFSFIQPDNYVPEDEYKFVSVNEPKIEQLVIDTPRMKDEVLLDDGYYVDSPIKFNKPQKHFTDLFNIETKKKDKIISPRREKDSQNEADSMTVKIWKALQNIKNWMNDSY